MAALTSAQSGNWTSASTWGGSTPADGDTFTITAGHLITVNSDVTETNGYGDITCHGKLFLDSGSVFRLNGRLTVRAISKTTYFAEGNASSGGTFEMNSGSTLEIRGSNSDQHSLWLETERYASIICNGSEKNLNTTLSGDHSFNQDYFSVSSATDFAAEDWLTIFRRDVDYRASTDEGFWVHDVDTQNNRIYFRQFVSPTAVISSSSGSTITVDNAKVFRVGYKLIFGTGANRNVRTVTSINRVTNVITLDSSVTGTVTGQTVYQTGNEKTHLNGSMVKRMATTLTTAITTANSTDQIIVGNASDINVGDYILLDVNNDTDTGWDYDSKYLVTAKSGNTLTLDDQVRHLHKVGSLVTILTRDTQIKAVDTASTTRVFIYIERWNSSNGYQRPVRFQNVWFQGLGRNTSSTYYAGFTVAGYTAILGDDNADYSFESRVDSCVYDSPNYRSTYTGFSFRDTRYIRYRNNVAYNSDKGYWGYSGNYNARLTNNYSTRNLYSGFQTDGWYDPYTRIAYMYLTRSDDYGFMVSHFREKHIIRHIILLNHEQRPVYTYYQMYDGAVFERFLIDGYRRLPNIGFGGKITFLDSKIRPNRWDGSAADGSGQVYSNYSVEGSNDGRLNYDKNGGKSSFCEFIEWNFEQDSLVQMQGNMLREWVADGSYWDVDVLDDSYKGFTETVYVPAGTTVRISCDVQCIEGNTATRPYLFAKSGNGGIRMGRFQNGYTGYTTEATSTNTSGSIQGETGFVERVQYTAASHGAWETKEITVQPQKKGYLLHVGIYNTSTNLREEGFKMRDIKILQDITTNMPVTNLIGQKNGVQRRANFTSAKKRISGRI